MKRRGLLSGVFLGGAALFAQTAPNMAVATIYVGDTPQAGAYDAVLRDLYDVTDWLTEYAQNGGDYTFVLGKDQKANGLSLDYGQKQVSITLKAADGTRTVTRDGNSLFTIRAGVTFTLEEGVTLSGAGAERGRSLVHIDGGSLIMNGGTISGNTTEGGNGGGVSVFTGTFTMNGGTISGNTIRDCERGGGGVYTDSTFIMNGAAISGNTADGGGGVYVSGTFTMSGGTISGNTGSGGGVYVDSGTFTMSSGEIGGNTATTGGGVYVNSNCAFTKSGGIIYGSNASKEQANKAKSDEQGHAVFVAGDRKKIRTTTADETTALDSSKNRIQGGAGNRGLPILTVYHGKEVRTWTDLYRGCAPITTSKAAAVTCRKSIRTRAAGTNCRKPAQNCKTCGNYEAWASRSNYLDK
jgi:hypothetical protein